MSHNVALHLVHTGNDYGLEDRFYKGNDTLQYPSVLLDIRRNETFENRAHRIEREEKATGVFSKF